MPDELKCANENVSKWFTAEKMIKLFLEESNGIKVIDLSGGNPELVPEWIVETMRALLMMDMQNKVYLWSDDTLTMDYTFRFFNKDDIILLREYECYGKVCCFKGFDPYSFTFNTKLPAEFYNQQFELFSKYLELGIDLYGYVTFTTDNTFNLEEKMILFINRLRRCHPFLPLRVIPLKIGIFSPTKDRIDYRYEQSLKNQVVVYNEWRKQLNKIYSSKDLSQRICDIELI